MKKTLFLSTLVAFAMICSCHKQAFTAEQQLAERKAELDAREKVFDERENGLAEREKALIERSNALSARENVLSEREKALAAKTTGNVRTTPADFQSRGQTPDPAQAKAERDRRIQQLPPELRALIPRTAEHDQKDGKNQDRAQRQLELEESRRQSTQRKLQISGAAAFPAAEASSPIPSPSTEAGSPTPSPAVEVASPSPSPTPE
jgi:hypothetical protein